MIDKVSNYNINLLLVMLYGRTSRSKKRFYDNLSADDLSGSTTKHKARRSNVKNGNIRIPTLRLNKKI